MTLYALPVNSEFPAYDVEVDLGDSLYTLRLTYNTRLAGWSFDILTSDGTVLVAGVRVVSDWGLFDRFVDQRMPAGQILAIDVSGEGIEPGINDLGDRVVVVYDDEGP